MSSAKSSSWPPDKGPGAETVAVPNSVSVGAVNHRGQGAGRGRPPFEDTSLLSQLICGQEGKPFLCPFSRNSHREREERESEREGEERETAS